MAIEIVDLPIEHGDFPSFFVCLPKGKSFLSSIVSLTSVVEQWPSWPLQISLYDRTVSESLEYPVGQKSPRRSV